MTQLEDATVNPPVAADGFLLVARQMIYGARTILGAAANQSLAVTHLCGHGAETALKAALSKSGVSLKELWSHPLGHNLDKLWARALSECIPLSSQPPDWLIQLNRVHGKPYSVRYPVNFHAIVLPNQQLMVDGCVDLLNQVAAFCK